MKTVLLDHPGNVAIVLQRRLFLFGIIPLWWEDVFIPRPVWTVDDAIIHARANCPKGSYRVIERIV